MSFPDPLCELIQHSINKCIKYAKELLCIEDGSKKRLLPFVKKYINTARTDDEEDEIHNLEREYFLIHLVLIRNLILII